MHHRLGFVIRPFRLIQIIGILGESCRIDLPKIRVLRMIGCRLPNIVEAAPDKLPQGEGGVPVGNNAGLRRLGPPAGWTVA
ncbi:hypothetical protein D3C75_1308240 [compost metagenome]